MAQSLRVLWPAVTLLACGSPPSGGDLSSDSADGEIVPSGQPVDLQFSSKTCARPGDRTALGPFEEWQSTDWRLQHTEPFYETEPAVGGWGVAVEDFDGDGRLDLYLPHFLDHSIWGGTDEGWEPVPGAVSDLREPFASGAAAGDMDGDGDVDLVLAGDRRHVLRNDGNGQFSPVRPGDPALVAEAGGSFSTALADLDGDGDLDVLAPVMAHSDRPSHDGSIPPGGPILVGWNDGIGSLSTDAEALPTDTNDGYPFQAALIDIDGDADVDVYAAFDHGALVRSNRVFLNDAARFTDWSEPSGAALQVNAMGLAVGDVNNDGLPDFAMGSIFEVVLIESLRATDGTPQWARTDRSRNLHPDPVRGQEVAWGTDFGDIDNDGDLDLWVGYGYKSRYSYVQPAALYQLNDGIFEDVASGWGVAGEGATRGGLLVDLDRDGWLDLVTRELAGPARIYRARCGDAAWLIVQPRQPGPNGRAVGARIEVELSDKTLTRWILAGGHSLASGGPAEVHLGLGDIDEVLDVRVVWPDGEVSRLGPQPTRGVLTVHRR